MSGVPSGGSTWKNIVIGILTTVVAYFIVHKIFENLDKRKENKNKKEANQKIWDAIDGYRISTLQKFQTISCYSCDYSQMRDEMIRELDQNCRSLDNLKSEPLIDARMKNIIERTVGKFTDYKPAYKEYFDSMMPVKALPLEVQEKAAMPVQKKFFDRLEFLNTRDTPELNEYKRGLTEDYKITFREAEPVFKVDTAALTRHTWKIECNVELTLKTDGTLSWVQPGNEFTGSWDRIKDVLEFNMSTGQKMYYKILALTDVNMMIGVPGTAKIMAVCAE